MIGVEVVDKATGEAGTARVRRGGASPAGNALTRFFSSRETPYAEVGQARTRPASADTPATTTGPSIAQQPAGPDEPPTVKAPAPKPAASRTVTKAAAPKPAPKPGPALSVVVVVESSQQPIDQCLTLLRSRSTPQTQIIVVDANAGERAMTIYERHASLDSRVTSVWAGEVPRGVARDLGAGSAKGKYLAFVDPEASIPRGAFATLAATLDKSGSDMAAGAWRRRNHNRLVVPPHVDALYRADQISTTVLEAPSAVDDLQLGNRLFRRSFWTSQHLQFLDGPTDGRDLMIAALTKAKRFDLVRAVTYHAGPDTSADENDGLARIAATSDAIRRTLSLPDLVSRDLTKQAWLTRFVEIDLDQLIQRVPWEDDAYWQALRQAATDVVSHVDTSPLVPNPQRMRSAVLAGRRGPPGRARDLPLRAPLREE